ncbi:hypothetical protein PINS_up010714 [Pythium insidiosum]|nr:hypothetical protein PINS_up010714 [Pythium insidiosum]
MENVTMVEPIDAARVLLTRLLDAATDDYEAQTALRRLYRLVIEESMARINAAWFCGLLLPTADSNPLSVCGVACGRDADIMLQVLQELEPNVSFCATHISGEREWRLEHSSSFTASDMKCVVVMPICYDADELSRVIEKLTIDGVSPFSICVACVGFVHSVAHWIQSSYPGVNVVAVTSGDVDDNVLDDLARRIRRTSSPRRC